MHPRPLDVWRKRPPPSPQRLMLLALFSCAIACGGGTITARGGIGADCLAQRNDGCLSSLCLALDSATAYCTQPCQSQTDCPANYLCLPSNGDKLCQARGAGGVCSVDADCPAGLQCDASSARCYIAVTRSACGACTSDKQCGTGGTCHAETSGSTDTFCAPACGAGNSCATGFLCAPAADANGAHRCLPVKAGSSPPAVGSCRGGRPLCASCTGNVECGGPGDLCVRNLFSGESFCSTKCDSTHACQTDFTCTDLSGRGSGPSQCTPNSQTCVGYCDGTDASTIVRECGLGSTCNTTTHKCKPLTDGSLCAACSSDDDCVAHVATSRCVVNRTAGSSYQGETFCGSDCSVGTCPGAGCTANSHACQTGFECIGLGTSNTWPYQCAPIRGSCVGGLQGLGDSCATHGADDCRSAICAAFGTERECTAACTTDSQCGDARWRCCKAIGNTEYDCSQAANGAAGICAPIGGSFGDDCSAGSPPCQDGLCLDLGTAQLCTQECSAGTTCPTGFSCEAGTDASNGSSVSVCFPNGGGDSGADCTFGPAACKSHLCLKKDSGNVCTLACTADTQCPATWSCLPVNDATDTSQSKVCVPAGTNP